LTLRAKVDDSMIQCPLCLIVTFYAANSIRASQYPSHSGVRATVRYVAGMFVTW